ncbi:MAG TPA: V-type ATPase subunit [Candidatus Bathyarchaeia archaeon]|nr:V-type ATPase subunit [Candidatus Bathyarchaeia archaeon]
MKPPQLVYLTTRVHGLSRHLIKPDDMKLIRDSRDLNEAIEKIPKSEYGEIIELTTFDAAILERIFLERMVERFYFIVNATSRDVQKFFKAYSSRFEMENVKRILRAIHRGKLLEEENLIPLMKEFTLVNFSALMAAKDLKEVVGLLRETDYGHLTDDFKLYEKFGTTSILEASLDKHYYERLLEIAQKIPNKTLVNDIIGFEIDLKNLMTILSLKMRGLEQEQIQNRIVERFHKVLEFRIEALMEALPEDFAHTLKSSYYAKFAEEMQTTLGSGSWKEGERIFSAKLHDEASEIAARNPYTLGYVLYYLIRCENEAKDLIAVVVSKQIKQL